MKKSLKDGGQIVGLIEQPEFVFPHSHKLTKPYGYLLNPTSEEQVKRGYYVDGDSFYFKVLNPQDPTQVQYETVDYFYSRETFKKAFVEAGYKDFEYHDVAFTNTKTDDPLEKKMAGLYFRAYV